MMSRGIFITGTDTGVGKTYVAAGIAAALRRRGVDVGVMKPAETGCGIRAGRLVPKDARRLMKAAGVHDSLELVNPYRFRKPLAPSMAAELEGKRVCLSTIMSAFHLLSRRHDFMIVECAGGIMAPLSEKNSYLELARAMKLPVMIVARPGLGTINHTLLTISALKARRTMVAGVIINYADNQKAGLAEKKSPAMLEKITGKNIVGTVSYGLRDFDTIVDALKIPSPLQSLPRAESR